MEIGFVKKAMKISTTMYQTFEEISNRKVLARLILIVFGIFLIAVILSACSGYRTFSSNIKELDFTFEVPKGWAIDSIQSGSDIIEVNTSGPIASERESSAKASFLVFRNLESNVDLKAQNMLAEQIQADEKSFRNYNLLKQGERLVDGINGYSAEYTYDFPNPWPVNGSWIVIPTRDLYIEIPRNGMVHEILISASQNEWNAREKDIQHILDTFKWK